MISLKEILESTGEDEITIISTPAEFGIAITNVQGNFFDCVPESYNDFIYKKFKLSDFNERRISEHINYLEMATIKSKRSYCTRRKVGALLVKNNNIIAEGYNGTPPGFENNCENCKGETHWYVQHAEANAILKMAKSNQSSVGSTLYNTLCPCNDCSKMLLGAEVSHVFFNQTYKSFDGLELLLSAGVKVYYIPKKLS